jgi:TolA-binding protein
MFRLNGTALRQSGVALVLAVTMAMLWASGDVSAKNKNSNPSATGAANGVAHRVAALEAAVGELTEFAEEAAASIMALEDQVADLEGRVAALEAAAEEPVE